MNMMETERPWCDLPLEMLTLILSHLFAGDLGGFHAVCRSWRSISPIRSLPPPVDSPLSQSPCLMILNENICKFFHPVYNATYHMDIPELSEARICCSNYGWLLMSRGERSVFFFNPFTKEKIELPDLPTNQYILTWCFSSLPNSSDCLVCGILLCGVCTVEICCIKCGEEDHWTTQIFDSNERFWFGECCPIVYNAKLYFLGAWGNMGIFDIGNNTWRVCGKPLWPNFLVRQCFMVENEGELLAVYVTPKARRVRTVRFNLSGMITERIESLGDKMLFVSSGGSFLETKPMATGMGNKIYFSKFHGDNGVFYSLSTRKYHSFDGCYSNWCPFNLIQPLRCTWIKPMHQRLLFTE